MGYFYPDEYGPYVSTRVEALTDGGAARPLWKRILRKVFQFNAQRLPELKPGRVLEIGCASGNFMHELALQGWDVHGIETSESAARAARGLGYPVHVGPLETAPDPAEPFDLVVGWMVLEHLHEPVEALRKLHRWTRPGGWLAVSVPNAGSWEFSTFGDAWYALQLPTQLFHYTPETLSMIFERTGWKMDRVFHQRTMANVLASVGYRVEDRNPDSRIGRALKEYPDHRGYGDVALYPLAAAMAALNQAGRITVWARRQ